MYPKSLVCILCETRAHKLTWKSFKNNLIDPLNADLALCIAVSDDYDFSNPYWQFAKYKFTFKEYGDWGLAYDECQHLLASQSNNKKLTDWRILLGIKDQWLGGVKGDGAHPGSAGILLYARWKLLQSIYSERLHLKYERFIITRSDFIWSVPHPDLSLLDPSKIWVPDSEGYGGITDRHTILSSNHLEPYLSCLSLILGSPDQLAETMQGFSHWNLERFLLHHLRLRQVDTLIQYFPYIMYSVRERGGSTSWSAGIWSDELGYYIKYSTEHASAVAISKVLKVNKAWVQLLQEHSVSCTFDSFLCTADGDFIVLDQGTFKTFSSRPTAIHDTKYVTIDISEDNGSLFLSSRPHGQFAREHFDDTIISRTPEGSISLYSRKDQKFYYISPGRELCLLNDATELSYVFTCKNRYINT